MGVMTMLDEVFLAEYARQRRKIGDSNLESAWRTASYRVSGLLVLPIAGLTVIIAMIVRAADRIGVPFDDRAELAIKTAVVIIGLTITFYLDRRFRRYLDRPPRLGIKELPGERSSIQRLRIFAAVMSTLAFSLCVLWYKMGN